MASPDELTAGVTVVRTSRLKSFGLAVMAAALMSVSAATGGGAWLLFWLIAPVAIYILLLLLRPPSVTLDEDGLTVRPLLSKPARLLWTDTVGVFEVVSKGWPLKLVQYRYKPERQPSFWDIAVLPPYLELSPDRFAELLNSYRERALAQAEHSTA